MDLQSVSMCPRTLGPQKAGCYTYAHPAAVSPSSRHEYWYLPRPGVSGVGALSAFRIIQLSNLQGLGQPLP